RCFDLDLAEVDRRQAVLPRDELRELLVLDVPESRQRRAQPLAGALGLFLRLLKLLEREHLLANQQLSDPAHSAVSSEKPEVFKGYRGGLGVVKRASRQAENPRNLRRGVPMCRCASDRATIEYMRGRSV